MAYVRLSMLKEETKSGFIHKHALSNDSIMCVANWLT